MYVEVQDVAIDQMKRHQADHDVDYVAQLGDYWD